MIKTQSKQHPVLKRLHKKIIYPVDIQDVQVKDGDGTTETHYSYYQVELDDWGDDISDSVNFAKKRYADLRKLAPMPHGYGSKDEQLEVQQEQGFSAWRDHCINVKNNFPKE